MLQCERCGRELDELLDPTCECVGAAQDLDVPLLPDEIDFTGPDLGLRRWIDSVLEELEED